MPLPLRTVLVIAVTLLAILGASRLVRRLTGAQGGATIQVHLAQTVVRLLLTVGIALVAGLRGGEDKAVLVFAVGATYFAAVVTAAWAESRRKCVIPETQARPAEGAR